MAGAGTPTRTQVVHRCRAECGEVARDDWAMGDSGSPDRRPLLAGTVVGAAVEAATFPDGAAGGRGQRVHEPPTVQSGRDLAGFDRPCRRARRRVRAIRPSFAVARSLPSRRRARPPPSRNVYAGLSPPRSSCDVNDRCCECEELGVEAMLERRTHERRLHDPPSPQRPRSSCRSEAVEPRPEGDVRRG